MVQVYKNERDFFKANGLDEFKDYEAAHSALVNALGYKHALGILHRYLTDEELIKAYNKDEHFNGVYRHSHDGWIWDEIGWLIYSGQDNIKFRGLSLSDMTGIAKATARMRVMELTQVKDGSECTK